MAVDRELAAKTKAKTPSGKPGAPGAGRPGKPNAKRQNKNERFGFGGKKRFAKSGDALSSGDLSGFNARQTKGRLGGGGGVRKPTRPGKARRKTAAGKR